MHTHVNGGQKPLLCLSNVVDSQPENEPSENRGCTKTVKLLLASYAPPGRQRREPSGKLAGLLELPTMLALHVQAFTSQALDKMSKANSAI